MSNQPNRDQSNRAQRRQAEREAAKKARQPRAIRPGAGAPPPGGIQVGVPDLLAKIGAKEMEIDFWKGRCAQLEQQLQALMPPQAESGAEEEAPSEAPEAVAEEPSDEALPETGATGDGALIGSDVEPPASSVEEEGLGEEVAE